MAITLRMSMVLKTVVLICSAIKFSLTGILN